MSRAYSEQTIGTRLRRAQEILLHISGFANYNPVNPQDQVAEWRNTVQQLEQAILDTATAEQQYRLATEQRQKAFRDDEFSVLKSLKYIRSIVFAQYPKTSRQRQIILGQLDKMSSSKRKKAVVPAIGAAAEGEIAKSPSQSHSSYASLTVSFRELVQILQSANYQSNLPEINLPNLQARAQQLSQLNDQVSQTAQSLEQTRRQRDAYLEQLTEGIQRIKHYTRYTYGDKSEAYLAVKPL